MARRTLLICLTAVAVVAGTLPVRAANHVRVVLDISKSMRKNDPDRQAILATLLLHDLADPDPSRRDSFEVIPFHPTQHWVSPSDDPPTLTGKRIAPGPAGRDPFVRTLSNLPYDGDWTYFHPGIREATDELQGTPGGAYDSRVIVLVTDGKPERPTRDAELRHIEDELLPELEEHGIRLYVLAFGPEAYGDPGFFRSLVRGPSGTHLGEVLVDPNGEALLESMTKIFSRSFGYDRVRPRNALRAGDLDLEGGTHPDRAAVIVSSERPKAPRLVLRPPAGRSLNTPEPVRSASVRGGSYSLQWVLSPGPGTYPFDTDAVRGDVAVLRPARLRLEVRPGPGFTQSDHTMAETPFPLDVLIRPSAGASGDPGPVDLSFRLHGDCRPDPSSGGLRSSWTGRPSAPPAGPGTVTPEGRVYTIQAELRADEENRSFYRGCIEIEARRHEAVVGALTGRHAHRVEVHPLLAMSPVPLRADAVVGDDPAAPQQALERHETACARFRLAVDAGELPHPSSPRYALRAALDPSVSLDGPLREAWVSLDGFPLEVEGKPGPNPGPWYLGREMDAEEILGEHRMCLHVGRPASGDPSKPLELPVRWTLQETPYDDFQVIRSFTLRALIAPPGLLQTWRAPLLLGLLALTLLGSLWHLRANRPTLPPDLGFAIAAEGKSHLESRPLRESSPLARWLGLVADRAISEPGSDRPLAWVRPTRGPLYEVRPARGIKIEPFGRSEPLEPGKDRHALAVHRPYRLTGGGRSYVFRLQYDAENPS